MGWWIVFGLVIAVIVYAVMLYNGLVTVKNNVSLAWANIDVLLKQRHDEIPKLVEICRQYRAFEQETLDYRMKHAPIVIDLNDPDLIRQ